MKRYEALKHAVKAHAGQVDKCGQPYILHPIAVAEALEVSAEWIISPDRDNAAVVALLHDVWEDTDYDLPIGDLHYEQVEALQLLTRQTDETFADYIAALADSPFAATVKLADLWHNLQPERLMCLPSAEALSLSRRYWKARDRIWEALGYEWWPEGGEG